MYSRTLHLKHKVKNNNFIILIYNFDLSIFLQEELSFYSNLQSQIHFLQKYKLQNRVLGKGVFSTVVAGTNKQNNKNVAVKVIGKNQYDNLSEVLILKNLRGCNGIIKFLDFFSIENYLYFIVMENFGQMNLLNFINLNGPVTEHQGFVIFKQILNTIIDCKNLNIFHKAIKGSNILINIKNLQVKIIGFGSACSFKKGNYTHKLNCSIFYLPPEWIKHKFYTAESLSIWNLGILLFNLFYQKMPFYSKWEILYSPVFLSKGKHLSIDAKLFVAWCLRKKIPQRITLWESIHHPWITKKYI